MPDRPLSILKLNTSDAGGGAAAVCWGLLEEYRRAGHDARLAVRRPSRRGAGVHALRGVDWREPFAKPLRWTGRVRGRETMDYPGARAALRVFDGPPDVVHAHNLHGDYFDLRLLPRLAAQSAVFLTLHDAWLLSGHCAHSLDCERWRSGCGSCPALHLYPALQHDGTAANWRFKQRVLQRRPLRVAAPCRWLADRVRESLLGPTAEVRVIRNGVDREVFRPGDRAAARRALDLPPDADVLLFAAVGLKTNDYKDYATLREAFQRLAGRSAGRPLLLLALGDEGSEQAWGGARLRFLPYEADPARVARCYHAADVYVHAARAETSPLAILQALSCGVPAVASAVGGIPEQIEDGVDGRLVPPGDPAALARALTDLLDDAPLRARARQSAGARVPDIRGQAAEYLAWFAEVRETRQVA